MLSPKALVASLGFIRAVACDFSSTEAASIVKDKMRYKFPASTATPLFKQQYELGNYKAPPTSGCFVDFLPCPSRKRCLVRY